LEAVMSEVPIELIFILLTIVVIAILADASRKV